jgi:hypothetical protein
MAVSVEVFSGLSDEESMRDVGFLIGEVLDENVRYAILDGVLIFYAALTYQHELSWAKLQDLLRIHCNRLARVLPMP